MSVCLTERDRNQFPSVLLQPLGHLSVSKINELRAGVEQCSAERSFKSSSCAIPSGFSGLRALEKRIALRLCKTSGCCPLTYGHARTSQGLNTTHGRSGRDMAAGRARSAIGRVSW